MPNIVGPVIPDHPRKVEEVPMRISAEFKNKGKEALRNPVTGLAPTDEQISNATLIAPQAISSAYAQSTPAVITQGTEGSCVAFGSGYNARSIVQYYTTGASSYSNSINVMSPEWLYDLTKGSTCAGGSSILNAFELMKNSGIVKWATVPYVSGTCTITPTTDQWTEAAGYKITSYSYVATTDVSAMKTSLFNNHPLVISFIVDSAFYSANSSFIWSAATQTTTYLGTHCVCIIGYDDIKNAYKIVNSWGTGWGDAGYSWIDYDLLPTLPCSYAYMIDGIVNPPIASNYPPVANAGYDQTVLSTEIATLTGTGSYDPDGTIVSYLWEQVSGPNTATLINTTLPVASASGMIEGAYIYKLTVTDDGGLTAFALTNVTVPAAVVDTITLNQPTKSKVGRNTCDVLTWTIALTTPPQSAEVQYGTSTTSSFSTIFPIIPYTAIGTYTTGAVNTRIRRYYKIRVLKADGTYIYSAIQSVK